jgi:hypothetical protein
MYRGQYIVEIDRKQASDADVLFDLETLVERLKPVKGLEDVYISENMGNFYTFKNYERRGVRVAKI